jgi:hypothetical protein
VPFLDEVVQRWSDRAVLLTGDGGDKVFPDLRPARRARTPEELAEILADENMLAPAAEVEGLLGLPAGTLLAELRAHVEQYPEPALEHKAVRMKIVERSRKWLFEGEDRNRCFLWQASPCFALPVFEAAMHVPDESKSGFRLYAEFQRQLEPVLLTLPHADSGMAIDSLRLRAYSLARRWGLRALGPLRRKVFRHPRGQPPAPPALRTDTLELLRAACAGESKLKVLLDERQAYDSVARSSRHSLYNWRTVLLLDQLWRQRIP